VATNIEINGGAGGIRRLKNVASRRIGKRHQKSALSHAA